MADTTCTLNDLIVACHHSVDGFVQATNGVHSDHLRHRLLGVARQRSDFAGELTARVRDLGGKPAEQTRGTMHKGWSQLHPRDDRSFVDDCIRREENTLRQYEQALARNLPTAIRPVIEGQRLAVQEALMGLRTFEAVRRAG